MVDLLLNHGSYLGIMAVLILTGFGLPVPEEVPVILAGVAASYGRLNPGLAFLACLFGALVGDLVMYGIGYHFGRGVLFEHRVLARHLTPEREQRIEYMIKQHGLKVFFISRFLVGLRSPVYLTAGILRVPLRRFLSFDLLCATTVVGTFFGLSYKYGNRIEGLWGYIRGVEMSVTFLVVVAVITVAVLYFLRRRRRRVQLEQLRNQRLARMATPDKATPLAHDPHENAEQIAT
ncbi:MAG: DedA family protein [Pirellulales bacterium]|nr:DedA family protein [Pirellulales bacterium]